MQLSEVAVQVRESDTASKRKDPDAFVFSRKLARKMVTIGYQFDRRERASLNWTSTPRVKWLWLAAAFKTKHTFDKRKHFGREKQFPSAA